MKKNNINNIICLYDKASSVFKALNLKGVPTAILFNKDNSAKLIITGDVNWYNDDLRQRIFNNIDTKIELPKNTYKTRLLINAVQKTSSKQ